LYVLKRQQGKYVYCDIYSGEVGGSALGVDRGTGGSRDSLVAPHSNVETFYCRHNV